MLEQIDGFEGVHGGNRIGKRNLEVRMLLKFFGEKEVCLVNTWYRKNEESNVQCWWKRHRDWLCIGGQGEQKVFTRCEGNSIGIAAPVSGRRCGQEEIEERYEAGVGRKRRVSKLKKGDMMKRFEERVEEQVNLEHRIYRTLLRMELWRLVMNCVGKRKEEDTEKTHGGGMKMWKKQWRPKTWHIINQQKVGYNTPT